MIIPANSTMKFIQLIPTITLLLACLFPATSMAHNKVVVIPMGGDTGGGDTGLDPFAPLAAPSPPNSDYTINSDTVIDEITGLEWQRTYTTGQNITRTWEGANAYCKGLVLQGYGDWHLPSVSELMSILSYGSYDPAINGSVFPSTKLDDEYWSATNSLYNSDTAWIVYFKTGSAYSHPKSSSSFAYARCVRSTRANGPLLQNNSNGTVTDIATGLTWQQEDDSSLRDWYEAILYCYSLELATKSDWRIPNIKELASIVNYRVDNPSIDNTLFLLTNPSDYWSASSDANSISNAWIVNFTRGNVNTNGKTGDNYIRCVR